MSAAPEPASGRLARLVPGAGPFAGALARDVDARATAVRRAAGAVVFDVGSPCAGMILLEHGALRVSRLGPEGRELMLYRVRPGETCVLTLSCLIGRSDYPARGVVEEDADGLLVPADLFHRLVAEVEAFRDFAFASFVERIAGLLDLATAVAFERLDRRLAAALLERVESSGRIELAVTHAELATELGTVRERVSRLLEGFAARGAVELGRGRIMVRDKSALRATATGQG